MLFIRDIAGFDWDEGNRGKCQKHGVPLPALETAFHGGMAIFPDPAHSQDEERFIGLGQTEEGRAIFMAFTLRHIDSLTFIRPISARYMHRKEVEHYEKIFSNTPQ